MSSVASDIWGAAPGVVAVVVPLVIAVLAVASYRRARVTIFEPERAAVFKLQMDTMLQVMDMFAGKTTDDLRENADIDECLRSASKKVTDRFDPEQHEKSTAHEPGWYVGVTSDDGNQQRGFGIKKGADPIMVSGPKPSTDRVEWVFIWTTPKYNAYRDEVDALARHPMLPPRLRELLNEYSYALGERTFRPAVDALDHLPDHLAALFPTKEEWEATPEPYKVDQLSIMLRDHRPSYQRPAEEITSYIADYYLRYLPPGGKRARSRKQQAGPPDAN